MGRTLSRHAEHPREAGAYAMLCCAQLMKTVLRYKQRYLTGLVVIFPRKLGYFYLDKDYGRIQLYACNC